MEFLVISDTHTTHKSLNIPKTDILIFAGDANVRTEQGFFDFIQWFGKQNAKHKIFVPGNHDKYCEDFPNRSKSVALLYKVNMLLDEEIEIEGRRIYGSPFTPTFNRWSFMLDYEEMEEKWKSIPDDLDILITHGPPKGILDHCPGGSVGCPQLLKRVMDVKPKYHVFGHIHESYGRYVTDDTVFINGSVLDGSYNSTFRMIPGGKI